VEREGALKAATEAAEAASRAKSDFLANMSHEIRTPMSAILGFAELLAECDHPTDRMRHAETIKRNGEHLLSLINDILDLSRIESGKLELERITCQPAKIAREAADLLRVRAEGKAIELKVEIDDGIGHVLGDPTRIRQVVVNLLGNAVKFTESGSVTLRLIGEGVGSGTTRVRFEVEDTGAGIAPEHQAAIFKHFEQADSSMARKFGG
jgi:signal transduction histidine kinase